MERLRAGLARWREHGLPIASLVAAVFTCALLLALILGVALRAGTEVNPPTVGRLVGHAAPDFALPAVRDGRQVEAAVRLRDQHGQPVLVVFFFSLCPHCAPTLQSARAIAAAHDTTDLRVLYVDSPAETASI